MTPSTAFDPLSEILASAATEPAPLSRRIGITPPVRRPKQEVVTPALLVKPAAPRCSSPPLPPLPLSRPSARANEPSGVANDDDPYSARLLLGTTRPTGRRAPSVPNAPVAPAPKTSAAPASEGTRTTSTTLPRPLLDQLHRARLADEIAGGKFKIQQRLNEAILELPIEPESVMAALQRYRSRLNFGVGTDDAAFIEEGRFTFRVTQSSERHMAKVMSGLYDHLGRRVHRQDLFGLAMIHCISK